MPLIEPVNPLKLINLSEAVTQSDSDDSNKIATTAFVKNVAQPLDATLTNLAGLNNTGGLLVQTGADTFTKRAVAGTTNRISVTNGDGVSANPTIDIGAQVLNWNSALNALATGNITTTSTTAVLVTGMTLTPGAGNYLVSFTSSVSNSNNARTMTFSIYVNGSIVAASELVVGTTSGNTNIIPVAIVNFPITVGAGQTVEIRWRTSASTATLRNRNFTLIRQG